MALPRTDWLKIAGNAECPRCRAQPGHSCVGPRQEYRMPHDERLHFVREKPVFILGRLGKERESHLDTYLRLYPLQEE